MEFQFCSDLHIEMFNNTPNPLEYIIPNASVLILAGDIGSFYKYDQLNEFIKKICEYYKIVIYVLGNHEYYFNSHKNDEEKMDFSKIKELKDKLSNSIKNLYILDRSSIIVNNVCIVGCTLWSDLKVEIPKFIVKIHGINNSIYNNNYNLDLNYIKYMNDYCLKNNLKLLVITHYTPSYTLISDSKRNYKYSSLYASDLDDFIKKSNIHTWIYGHCHFNSNTYIGKTNVISNQKGKNKDNVKNYNKNIILKI